MLANGENGPSLIGHDQPSIATYDILAWRLCHYWLADAWRSASASLLFMNVCFDGENIQQEGLRSLDPPSRTLAFLRSRSLDVSVCTIIR